MFSGYLVTQKERGEQASIFMKKVAGGDICPPLLLRWWSWLEGKREKCGYFSPQNPHGEVAGKGRLSCIQMGIRHGRESKFPKKSNQIS